ncbi:MAG: N-acetylmuramoyl-L-alanine amidase [Bacteroidales bacterium]|nr:N-acetylmuramoyl-L-alanine amidase [Bacteroidales bacterium]
MQRIFIYQIIISLALTVVANSNVTAQVTGLSRYEIFIDPGHSQKENMGLYNYSEAEKVLRIALELKDLFESQTDIYDVHLSRLTDDDVISLSERTDLANSLGADFYYSIHSDAGAPEENTTLMLYGGFKNNGNIIEKSPKGGRLFGEILSEDLTGAMRIGERGNYADRIYYNGNEYHHSKQYPYLHVNRTTSMASLLSEGGFHTNPGQQQLNMNARWKKLEALSAFRSFLEYKGLDRPAVGVLTGIVRDEDTGEPLNDCRVRIDRQLCVTDSYNSLFKKYSDNPDELANGFYWLEGLQPGASVSVSFSKDNYRSENIDVEILSKPNGRTADNLTFLDFYLRSLVPARVKRVFMPVGSFDRLKPGQDIVVVFDRKMNQASVEEAMKFSPEAKADIVWLDELSMKINTSDLEYETTYDLTIQGSVARNLLTDQMLDGNADGAEGGDYVLQFSVAPFDVVAPVVVEQWPEDDSEVNQLRPVIRIVYDEVLNESSLNNAVELINKETAIGSDFEISYQEVNEEGVLHIFPLDDLENGQTYQLNILAGVEDVGGNASQDYSFEFTLNNAPDVDKISIDAFENELENWWTPQASGSTEGIITEVTNRQLNKQISVRAIGSKNSLQLNYGWTMPVNGYIRLYLPPDAQQNSEKFSAKHVLRAYVFGDKGMHDIRFVIRDGNSELEASPWFTINWLGWKLLEWDLSKKDAVAWANGDGQLDGSEFYLDGIHLQGKQGGLGQGTLFIDDLAFARYEYKTGWEDELAEQLKVYPNPAVTEIFIDYNKPVQQVELYDLGGRLVQRKDVKSKHVKLMIGRIPDGLYVLCITLPEGRVYRKVMIVGTN